MSEDFIFDVPKTLPVILLLDNSGSMSSDDHIIILNNAVNTMLKSFREMDSIIATISVAVITFGGEVKMLQELKLADDSSDVKLEASGGTPYGKALRLAKEMIENRESFPKRSYRPMVITVSDGLPNDEWQVALDEFKTEGRSSKCHCLAMSIGAPDGTPAFEVLTKFADGKENVYFAENAKDIHKFFKFITTTIKTRTQSSNPNEIPKLDIADIPDIVSDDNDILY